MADARAYGRFPAEREKPGAFTQEVVEQNTYRWDKPRRYRIGSPKSPQVIGLSFAVKICGLGKY